MARPISVAMIVKNESAQLAHCLDSLTDVADEICIVDTGSQDDTLDIARRFHARVGTFPWCDDFSAARNQAIALCTGDWILVVDADERLAAPDLPRIRALADGAVNHCYRMMTRNYTNAADVSDCHTCEQGDPHALDFTRWFPSWKVRMFPSHADARYEGKVHELIRGSLEHKGIQVLDSDAVIHHYPLLRDPQRVDQKRRLYLRLGAAKVRDHPDDPNSHAELGHQYAELRDYANAAAAYRESLKISPRNAQALKDLGGVLHLMGRDDAARQSLRLAVEYDPGQAEAWRNLGVIHADQGEWPAASDCFTHAVHLAPDWADGPRYLSVALAACGRLAEAVQAAHDAIELQPNSSEALDLYVEQMTRLGRAAQARTVLEGLCRPDYVNPHLSRALEKLGPPPSG